MAVTKAQLTKMVLAFPGMAGGSAYGMPAFRVEGKFFTRFRDEDASIVLHVESFDERDMLVESDPAIFHITDHYRNSRMVLARIARIDARTLHGFLARRYRAIAPKRLVKEFDRAAGVK